MSKWICMKAYETWKEPQIDEPEEILFNIDEIGHVNIDQRIVVLKDDKRFIIDSDSLVDLIKKIDEEENCQCEQSKN